MIWILISVVGMMSVFQISKNLEHQKWISNEQVETSKIVMLIFVFSISIALRNNPFLLSVVTFSVTFIPLLLNWISVYIRNKQIEECMPVLVDSLILSLRAGRGINDALASAAAESKSFMKVQILNLQAQLRLQNHDNKTFASVKFDELFRILYGADKKGHRIIEQLSSLRRTNKISERFRRRSRQMSTQVRAQSVFSTILFVSLLGFRLLHSKWEDIQTMVFLATALFLPSLILIHSKYEMRWRS
jgi:Flp pilus assembly protein TadB